MDIHTEYDDDPMVDEGDNMQTYSSPRKPDSKKPASNNINKSSQAKPKPPAPVVSMQKQPSALISSSNGPRSTTPSNQVKRVPKAIGPQKNTDSSPRYPQPPVNSKPPPPLPCEQPIHCDDGDGPSTISGGSPKQQLYFSKQPRPIEFK